MAHVSSGKRWRRNTIPFRRSASLPANTNTNLNQALQMLNNNTAVRLVEHHNPSGDFIRFMPIAGNASNSSLGRQGGRQDINLAAGASVATILHEVGHAIGLWHEHQRRDRNDRVMVNWEFVPDDKRHNFERAGSGESFGFGPYEQTSRMHYGPNTFSVQRYNWSSGWDVVSFYTIGGTTFLFTLKSVSGTMHVSRMNANGSVGAQIENRSWSSGWTHVEPFTASGNQYLFLLKSGNGRVHIHRLLADGTIGALVANYNWSSGWNTSRAYMVGGTTYMLFVKSGNGVAHLHLINADGTVGTRIAAYDWTSGWTQVQPFYMAGQTFLFFLKLGNGRVHIRSVNPDGTLGALVGNYNWSSGWTSAFFYTSAGSTYLLLLKEGNGVVHVHLMNTDGTVGTRTDTRNWSSGWSTAASFTGTSRYLFLLKKSNGHVHIHTLGSTIGNEIAGGPTLVAKNGKPLGGATTLTPLDINALNSILPGNFHVHQFAAGDLGARGETRHWSAGWTVAEPFVIGAQSYLFLLKTGTGDVHIHVLNSAGHVGAEVVRYDGAQAGPAPGSMPAAATSSSSY